MGAPISRLLSDSIGRGVLLLTAVVATLYLFPFDPSFVDLFDEFAANPLFTVVTLLLLLLAGRGKRLEEGRFWRYLALGFVGLLVAENLFLVEHVLPAGLPYSLPWDLTYVLLYLFLALAAETRPHRRPGWSVDHPEYRFGLSGTVVFAFGMLCYFALIPSSVDVASYDSYVPSYLLYIGLDLYLTARFAMLTRDSLGTRWAPIYGAICVTGATWVVVDVLEALNVGTVIFIARASAWSMIWFLPYLGMCAAARLGALGSSPAPATKSGEEGPDPELRFGLESGGPLIAVALAFPVIHFGLYAAELLGPASRAQRELLVLVLVVVLGALAVLQNRLLGQRNRRLQVELQRSREELQRAQRLEAIGRLAGGVAHDFNNLLTAIQGSTELVRRKSVVKSDTRRLFETIDTATTQARALTQQLLAFGRKQHLEPQVISLNEMISESDDLLAGILGPEIERRIELRSDPSWVSVDPVQVGQVLLNLAANARDAMAEGGTFTISTRNAMLVPDSADAPPGLVPGPHVVLEAADTGIGMSREALEGIFEPFYTTKERQRGTGLGLASVYGAIQQSGGGIRVESEPGRGTTFVVYLPLAEEPAREPERDGSAERRSGPLTILVVDDEPAIVSVVAELMEAEGHRVLTASNGKEALERAGTHRGDLDLLLTDVVMPEIDGVELVNRMRLVRPEITVLFMSGYSGTQRQVQKVNVSGARMIRKPFTLPELLGEIESVLQRLPAKPASTSRDPSTESGPR